MLINWFTVIAQIINFFILVWLLKRFLYKPILKAIDEREKKIATQIEDAEKKDADAKKEKEKFLKKNDAFDNEQDGLMRKAIEEIKVEKLRLLEEARKESLALRVKLEKTLKEDQEHIGDEIVRKTKSEVFAIARKTLKELADADLEEKMVNVFIKHLKNLDENEEKKLTTAFKSSDKPIVVRSMFELTVSQHTEIKKTFKDEIGTSSKFQFETTPELICGIEMNANGYKVEWSISEYLASVEKSIEEIIKSKTKEIIPDKEVKKPEDKKEIEPKKKETVKSADNINAGT